MAIKLEDLKKELETNPEIKEFVESLIEENITGLKNKNSELIVKNKKLVTDVANLQTKVEEFESASLDGDKDALKKKQIDIDSVTKKITEKYEKEKKDLLETNSKLQYKLTNSVVERDLLDALAKNNIAKQHFPAVKALLKTTSKIEISDDEENSYAVVGDKKLDVFVKEWAQGDIGKNYIAAPNNSGGGSNGSNNNSQGNIDASKLSAKEKMNLGRAKTA